MHAGLTQLAWEPYRPACACHVSSQQPQAAHQAGSARQRSSSPTEPSATRTAGGSRGLERLLQCEIRRWAPSLSSLRPSYLITSDTPWKLLVLQLSSSRSARAEKEQSSLAGGGDLAYLNTGKELQLDLAARRSGRKPGRRQNAADAGGRPLELRFSSGRCHATCAAAAVAPAQLGPAARQPGSARRPEPTPLHAPRPRPPAWVRPSRGRPPAAARVGAAARTVSVATTKRTLPALPTSGCSGEGSGCPPSQPGAAPAAGSPRDGCPQPAPTAEPQGRAPAPQSRRPSCATVAEREELNSFPSSPCSAQCAAAAPEPPQSPSRLSRTCRGWGRAAGRSGRACALLVLPSVPLSRRSHRALSQRPPAPTAARARRGRPEGEQRGGGPSRPGK